MTMMITVSELFKLKHRRRGRPLKPYDVNNIKRNDKPFDIEGPLHHEKGGLTINGLRRLLMLELEESDALSIAEWGERHGIAHPSEIYHFLRGGRSPSGVLLLALGYTREHIFIRKTPVGVDKKIHSNL